MVLVIDNYDSFTFNLVQYLGEMTEVQVYRNDGITVQEVKNISPSQIVISPGPGRPEATGISLNLIREVGRQIPILGVCLGHQCIGQVFGAEIVEADEIYHGKTSLIYFRETQQKSIMAGLESPFPATRYHSLIIKRDTLPPELKITAETAEGEIMGIKHRNYPLYGVQFHPESILTESGKQILKNFLNLKVRRTV